MKSNGLIVACAVGLALVVALYVANIREGIASQEQRRECMSALSTPAVTDPAYDEKSTQFTEGIEACMQATPQE